MYNVGVTYKLLATTPEEGYSVNPTKFDTASKQLILGLNPCISNLSH